MAQVACSLTDGVDGVLRDMQFLVIDNDTLFTKHDHEQRPHQGIANDLIELSSDEPPNGDGVVVDERLCELLHKGIGETSSGEMIVKPLDGAGGRGIFHIARSDRNARVILETGTAHGRQLIMAQQYVPEVRQGDKRIILIEGEPAGAVLRVPADDDARANFHTGARAVRTQLTDREREICARIGPVLRDRGVIFAGIDVLGDYLTEINVTSPTGLREIEHLDGIALEGAVLDAVATRAS